MLPQEGGGHRDVLFVEPNPGKSDATFFTDRVKGELWVGPRLGVPESRARFGIDECRALGGACRRISRAAEARHAALRACCAASPRRSTRAARADRARQGARDGALRDAPASRTRWRSASCAGGHRVHAARLRGRDPRAAARAAASARWRACSTCARASRATTSATAPSPRPAPTPARCTGPSNDGALKKGDLLLLDAGVEGNSLYTADITRTLPIGGTLHQGAARDLRARLRGAGARRSRR